MGVCCEPSTIYFVSKLSNNFPANFSAKLELKLEGDFELFQLTEIKKPWHAQSSRKQKIIVSVVVVVHS